MSGSQFEFAKKMDGDDILHPYREEFYTHSATNQIYLDGNSLGLLNKRSEQAVLELLEAWKTHAIDGWTEGKHPWFTMSEQLGRQMASLVGANSNEVIVSGSTTVNLHQILATFYKPTAKKHVILSEALSFPTDLYAMQSHIQLHGYQENSSLRLVTSNDGYTLSEDDIIAAMTDDVAIIVLSSVLYRSGQLLDLKKLTTAAHERGILIGFDLCHSIGSVPHELSNWGVDFAFWCTYKHVNGGPGSVAGMYINQKHHHVTPGLRGWFGSDKSVQFDMDASFTKADGAGAFQLGTPHLLSIAPLIGSLAIMEEASIARIRKKSIALTSFFIELVDTLPELGSFTVRTPREVHARGGHVLLEHPEAARICKALKAKDIIPDFRQPNGIRFAPVALYNSFTDVHQALTTLAEIMRDKAYEEYENSRGVIA
ncbi:kynureninase [Bacillus sp. JCM 19045]|nr:kynureninase [Bacillus sp. JCM 19045]